MSARDEPRPDREPTDASHPVARVRLEPMSEEDYAKSVKRSISRYAAELVQRGLSTKEGSLEVSRQDFERFLPQGLKTPGHHLCNLLEITRNVRVGETWYTVQGRGGKPHFWIDWIWIDAKHRRHGYASQTLRLLEERARQLGADRTGLSVWMDNPGAVALYSKLGYVATNMRMTKLLDRAVEGGPR